VRPGGNRLKTHVESSPAGGFAGLLQRNDLGVGSAGRLGEALAHHPAFAHQHSAHRRVWGNNPCLASQGQSALDIVHGINSHPLWT
jgi:hypothetical protein